MTEKLTLPALPEEAGQWIVGPPDSFRFVRLVRQPQANGRLRGPVRDYNSLSERRNIPPHSARSNEHQLEVGVEAKRSPQVRGPSPS